MLGTPVVAKFGHFWRKLAQVLERHRVERTKRAVPEIALRRSKHEVERFRRLMLKGSLVPAHAHVQRLPSPRVAQARPR
jgi:hypothetical protein